MTGVLLTAITTKFGTAGLSSSFPGGLHYGIAPERTAMPFVTMTVISAPRETVYGNTERTKFGIQFAGYGNAKVALNTAMEALATAYHDTILTLSSGAMFDADQTTDIIDGIADEDGQGETVEQAIVDFEFSIRS